MKNQKIDHYFIFDCNLIEVAPFYFNILTIVILDFTLTFKLNSQSINSIAPWSKFFNVLLLINIACTI